LGDNRQRLGEEIFVKFSSSEQILKPKGPARQRRVRLDPEQRAQMILDAAISFFADHGFSAQTRQLAEHVGVSQSLIFRYFGSKEALIERVYAEVFLSRWNPDWDYILADRSKSLCRRLEEFYRSYIATVDDRRWIRIAMHSSLENNDLTRRYIEKHVSRLLRQIVLELRYEAKNPSSKEPSSEELEQVWFLHSAIVYYSIRHHIHKTSVLRDRNKVVSDLIHNFLYGMLDRQQAQALQPPS
jgi:AcrR family transcriptional regulator